jgi:hypothetical protein
MLGKLPFTSLGAHVNNPKVGLKHRLQQVHTRPVALQRQYKGCTRGRFILGTPVSTYTRAKNLKRCEWLSKRVTVYWVNRCLPPS